MLDTTRSFFKLLWPDSSSVKVVDNCLTLWRLPDRAAVHIPLANLDRQLEGVLDRFSSSWTATGRPTGGNVAGDASGPLEAPSSSHAMYYGVGLRKPGLRIKGGNKQVAAWPGLWVDLDFGKSGHAGKNYPPDESAAVEILEQYSKLIGDPTLLVHSGHGFHAYWLFDEPSVDSVWVSLAVTALQDGIREIASPYMVDVTSDLARVLAIPGMWNCKAGTVPLRVEILVDDGPRYSVDDLQQALLVRRPPPTTIASDRVSSSRHLQETPPRVEAVAGGGAFSASEFAGVVRRIQNTTDENRRERALYLLAGRPFAQPGERNIECNRLVGLITNYVFHERPSSSPEEIYEQFFAASVDAMAKLDNDPANPALDRATVVDQIARMWKVAVDDAERERAQAERLARALRRSAEARGKKRFTNVDKALVHVSTAQTGKIPGDETARRRIEEKQQERQAGTPAKLRLLEPPPPEQPMSAEDRVAWFRRLIVQHRDAYFIWRDNRYQSPVSREELEVKSRDDFENVPGVDWYYEDAQGKVKRKTITQFKNDYCTAARHLIFDLTIRETYYDAETETLFVAAAPLRDLEPRYDERIAEWLRIFGGDEHERLYDWIATVTDLDYQSCALYASGPPGTGKSLLAQGLARLWSPFGEPTALKNLIANFNADLLRCPFVHVDEAVPSNIKTTDLREMLGMMTRTVTQKFMPNCSLRGAIRLMLTANNEDLLAMGDEHKGANDVEAVAERFFYVRTSKAAAEFLRRMGGPDGTREWVNGDLIARHALWMSANLRANFKPGGRFLVEGTKTQAHRALVIGSSVTSLVLEWLTKFLMKPITNVMQSGNVVLGSGKLLVNTLAIADHWQHYITSHSVYSTTKIGSALASISIGTERVNEKRYWVIDPFYVFQWAEQHNVGDTTQMTLRINTAA